MTENERARFQELAQRNELIGQAAQAQANEEVIRWAATNTALKKSAIDSEWDNS